MHGHGNFSLNQDESFNLISGFRKTEVQCTSFPCRISRKPFSDNISLSLTDQEHFHHTSTGNEQVEESRQWNGVYIRRCTTNTNSSVYELFVFNWSSSGSQDNTIEVAIEVYRIYGEEHPDQRPQPWPCDGDNVD
jgi:outer membrane phospholipase A